MLLKLITFLSLVAPATVIAAEPDAREPTARWVVNFADAQCIARRAYGSAEDPLHLILKAPPLGEVMQVAVMREEGPAAPVQVEATIGIDGRPPIKTNMLAFAPESGGLRVHLLNMPSGDFALVREAKSLQIRSARLNETFALSQMGPLLQVMEECVTDLRQVWNVANPDGTQSALPQRARAELYKLFDPDDYPPGALGRNQSGIVKFVALVDENGRVADCTIIETSGVAALDVQTCAIIQERAKFEPAVGQDGKRTKDAVIQGVRWKLPD